MHDKFWRKITPLGADECWEWEGGRNDRNYGQIIIDGKMMKAHRLSWLVNRGPIPEGMCVCHRCDNPPCCNPNHLFLGTHKENHDDKINKGRTTWQTRTHCKHGHEFLPETIYRGKKGIECLVCRERRMAEFEERFKQGIVAERRVTHCPRGHEISGTNEVINYRGARTCKICKNDWMRAYRAKQKANLVAGNR